MNYVAKHHRTLKAHVYTVMQIHSTLPALRLYIFPPLSVVLFVTSFPARLQRGKRFLYFEEQILAIRSVFRAV